MGEETIERTTSIAVRLASIAWAWRREDFDAILRHAGATRPAPLVDDGWTRYDLDQERLDVLASEGLVERVEVTLEAFVDVPDLSGAEYEDKVDEFFALWEHAVAAAEIELGRPAFDDGGAARGYPEDQDAVWLALWPLPTGRLMIQELHEDRELPFRLAVVVTPPMT